MDFLLSPRRGPHTRRDELKVDKGFRKKVLQLASEKERKKDW
jgi:hypothetical protein